MERLELVVVQLTEAQRLIGSGRAPQLRLAFILLDNAVEVVLHRLVQQALMLNDLHTGLLKKLEGLQAAGVDDKELHELLTQTRSQIVGGKELRALESFFDKKVSFLAERDAVPVELPGVLKKLHQYRNEVYHQDKLRPEILLPAVRVYFDVACTVLESYSPYSLSYSSDYAPGPEMQPFVGRGPVLMGTALPKKIAARLRAELHLDLAGVRTAFSSYLLARLDNLETRLASIDDLPWLVAGDALRIAQFPRERPFDLEKSRGRPGKYRKADLSRWRAGAQALTASSTDKHTLITQYATIEDELEPLETLVHTAADEIEQGIEQGLASVQHGGRTAGESPVG
ncbi:hypothetical protein OG784_42295 [Streptomyces sp. NBC_01617]|uniref:hypothetical protein n=1 Tax=Streptomyces sp. NBC_01617 TaxID=2975899 RepID=UPI00386C1682|nr:hypothetical protein OG784_00050 [Streptomyces sp. NBC_01617]WTE64812.1 hypothetical protein OG784_42295 [Streptomyces sp. NBC_01617]